MKMITYILKHKTRNGLIAFLLGLIVAVSAMYIDQLRGEASPSMGLYQIVGALAGYTLSSIGGVLVMKESDLRKTLQNILFYSGGLILLISITADYIGVAGAIGFDKFQIAGGVFGMIILAAGYFIFPLKFSS